VAANLMVFLRNLLLFAIIAGVIFIIARTLGSDESTDQASLFLQKLQDGDAAQIVPQFGENTCHCQPRGGYLAYLKYESGEQDNLAFLLGHPFSFGEFVVKSVPTISKYKGGDAGFEKPESVEIDTPISMDKGYSPYFLPMDMAFGYPMKKTDFDAFCKDPSPDFARALSVRLRPTLASGLVAKAAPPEKDKRPEFSADLYKELLPPEETRYLKPTDAAEIVDNDGKTQPAASFQKDLPRLKRAVLRLYIGRRGELKRWAVKKVRLKDPVFQLADGKELVLETPSELLVDPVSPLKGASHQEDTENESAPPQ
jgi:hypothetical protein